METLHYIQKAITFIDKAIHYIHSEYAQKKINAGKLATPETVRKWTTKIVFLVEIVYALDTVECVDNGDGTLEKLADDLGRFFGVNIRDCFNTYVYMKKRKGDSRAYFLDELSRRLNERMEQDDEKLAKASK